MKIFYITLGPTKKKKSFWKIHLIKCNYSYHTVDKNTTYVQNLLNCGYTDLGTYRHDCRVRATTEAARHRQHLPECGMDLHNPQSRYATTTAHRSHQALLNYLLNYSSCPTSGKYLGAIHRGARESTLLRWEYSHLISPVFYRQATTSFNFL